MPSECEKTVLLGYQNVLVNRSLILNLDCFMAENWLVTGLSQHKQGILWNRSPANTVNGITANTREKI